MDVDVVSVNNRRTLYTIYWIPPAVGWVKANSDGASKGNPGPAACGGLFRDHNGVFLGGFGLFLGYQDAFYAEIMAVILVIEKAFEKGWFNLWLESDSMLVVNLLANSSLKPPLSLRNRWRNCKKILGHINFRFTHTFRENNSAADHFANLGLHFSSFTWWGKAPNGVQRILRRDALGLPHFRIKRSHDIIEKAGACKVEKAGACKVH